MDDLMAARLVVWTVESTVASMVVVRAVMWAEKTVV